MFTLTLDDEHPMTRLAHRRSRRANPAALGLLCERLESRIALTGDGNLFGDLGPGLPILDDGSSDLPMPVELGDQDLGPPATPLGPGSPEGDPGIPPLDSPPIGDGPGIPGADRPPPDLGLDSPAPTYLLGPDSPPIGTAPLPGPEGTESPLNEGGESTAPRIATENADRLGSIDGRTLTVAEDLELGSGPGSVRLHRFELTKDGTWSVGAEVATTAADRNTQILLTLLDSEGHVIATGSRGVSGRSDSPYLFVGLRRGTYYLAVSSSEVVPHEGSIAGSEGSRAENSPSDSGRWPFTLRIVAEPARPVVHVVGFGLDHADPLDSAPTGIRLGFSSAVRPFDDRHGTAVKSLELVDDAGRSWPIAVSTFGAKGASLQYVFGSRLPSGHYRVRVPEIGGLRDLADRAPIADGLEPRVLAEFTVEAINSPRPESDLGTLFTEDYRESTFRSVELRPGESKELRFVMPASGSVRFDAEIRGGTLAAWVIDEARGTITPLDLYASNRFGLGRPLDRGVYRLRLAVSGDRSVSAELEISRSAANQERLLPNGLGQDSTLQLRLAGPPAVTSPISPTVSPAPSPTLPTPGSSAPVGPGFATESDPVVRTQTEPAANPSTIVANPAPVSNRPAVVPRFEVAGRSVPNHRTESGGLKNVAGAVAPRGPSGLFLAIGGQPVGRSALLPNRVTPVGPDYGLGSVALAIHLNSSVDQSIPFNPALLWDLGLEPGAGYSEENSRAPATTESEAQVRADKLSVQDPVATAILAEPADSPGQTPWNVLPLGIRLLTFLGLSEVSTRSKVGDGSESAVDPKPVTVAVAGLDETGLELETHLESDRALAVDLPTAALALAFGAGAALISRQLKARRRAASAPPRLPDGLRASRGRLGVGRPLGRLRETSPKPVYL